MTRWRVIKTGIERFDLLHTYGLSVILATLGKSLVSIQDQGVAFSVEGPLPPTQATPERFLEQALLPLPTEEELLIWSHQTDGPTFSIRIFDGLLAALITIPGPKILSVWDAIGKQQNAPEILSRGLLKVRGQIQRWEKFLQRTTQGQKGWVEDMLTDYQEHEPTIPHVGQGSEKRDLSVLMPIDAFFGYALRSPYNDGRMQGKTNVAVHKTRYATLLAFIGASRFLRAQRLADNQVALFLTYTSKCIVTAETALPILSTVPYTQDHSLTLHWLRQFLASAPARVRESRLLYQVLQSQGTQQPLTIAQGELEDQRLQTLENQVGRSLLLYWRCLLEEKTDASQEEQQQTAYILRTWHLQAWFPFLTQRAYASKKSTLRYQRRYHLKEVRQFAAMMHTPSQFPLTIFFDQEEGVLCYGRALRLLGDYHAAVQQDLLDLLSQVRTREGLFPILARIGQECEFAKGKWKYLIVPTEKDARALCVAIDRYGVTLVVGMILLLSSVRYPKNAEERGGEKDETGEKEPSPSSAESITILHMDADRTIASNEEEIL